ncbi:hypothetical protein FH972_024126 [Carpinus fangiana]|uniref:Uncharacterized protein n=1 Tax=Carpinus fangiana TaxID=176857 RepID=A0A5N6KX45_9ROSI|nr:hypothetical protein FH972_024126 [Carpinus fangiana]
MRKNISKAHRCATTDIDSSQPHHVGAFFRASLFHRKPELPSHHGDALQAREQILPIQGSHMPSTSSIFSMMVILLCLFQFKSVPPSSSSSLRGKQAYVRGLAMRFVHHNHRVASDSHQQATANNPAHLLLLSFSDSVGCNACGWQQLVAAETSTGNRGQITGVFQRRSQHLHYLATDALSETLWTESQWVLPLYGRCGPAQAAIFINATRSIAIRYIGSTPLASVPAGFKAAVDTASDAIEKKYFRGSSPRKSTKDPSDNKDVITVGYYTASGTRLPSVHVHEDGTYNEFLSRAGKNK